MTPTFTSVSNRLAYTVASACTYSSVSVNDYRTKKKDVNKQRWLDLLATSEHEAATKVRYRVEQPFGTAKQKHGFGRCRYLGLFRYAIQAFVTFMVLYLVSIPAVLAVRRRGLKKTET